MRDLLTQIMAMDGPEGEGEGGGVVKLLAVIGLIRSGAQHGAYDRPLVQRLLQSLERAWARGACGASSARQPLLLAAMEAVRCLLVGHAKTENAKVSMTTGGGWEGR